MPREVVDALKKSGVWQEGKKGQEMQAKSQAENSEPGVTRR
jgi:hypothetical protein